MTATILTRRELYDLVWSKPLREVASDLGISDVGLAKVCVRHRVPRPEQGYWNKLHAGKLVKKAVFVDVDDVYLDRVEINGALSRVPEEVRTRLKENRVQRRAKGVSKPRPQTSADLHMAVEPTVRALRKAKPNATGNVRTSGKGLCQLEISAASVERVVSILDGLARALEARGIPLQPDDSGVVVAREKDLVQFDIKERTRRQKHEPTAAELEVEARRERKLKQYWAGSTRYGDPGPIFNQAYPEFDIVQTGALSFLIDGYDRGMRHTWADGKSQKIDRLLESIVDGIEAILVFRRVEREQREERERRWNELCQRRELARKRSERERQRLGYWRRIARIQRETGMLRQWLEEAARSNGDVTTNNVRRMVDWIRLRLAALEESISIRSVDEILSSSGLFPEVDDLTDPLGDPPNEPRYDWQM